MTARGVYKVISSLVIARGVGFDLRKRARLARVVTRASASVPGNLDRVAASILEPEVPAEGMHSARVVMGPDT